MQNKRVETFVSTFLFVLNVSAFGRSWLEQCSTNLSYLSQQDFTLALYKTINQINNPPFLVMIERRNLRYNKDTERKAR